MKAKFRDKLCEEPETVNEALRETALKERCKIHDFDSEDNRSYAAACGCARGRQTWQPRRLWQPCADSLPRSGASPRHVKTAV